MKKLYFILSIILLVAFVLPTEAATNWKTYKIMLDPGHGGSDSGAGGYGGAPHEATLALRCGLSLRDRIQNELGGTVKMTRTTNKFVELSTRREMKGSYDPYIFCSIHLNAFNKTAKGTETLYTNTTGNSGLLANKVQPQLIANFNAVSGFTATNRGVKTASLAVCRGYAGVPAILTEGLFVDNKTEWNLIKNESSEGFKRWVHGHLMGFYDRLVLLNGDIQKPTYGGGSSSGGGGSTTDTTKPSIARTTTAANNTTSFYAYAQASDNKAVSSVKFKVYANNNGSSTAVTAQGTSGSWTVGGNSYNYRYLVNASDHKNATGTYTVTATAADAAGNSVTSSAFTYTFSTAAAKITSNPTSLTLSAQYGSATKPTATLTITATGLTDDMVVADNTSAIDFATSSWNAKTGGKITVTVNTNFTLGPGVYNDAYIAVESGSGTSKVRLEIPVNLTLTDAADDVAQPSIVVNPISLVFGGEEGAAIASQTVKVTTSDLSAAPTVSGATDKFTVTSSLTVDGGSITVTPKTTLAAGTHTGTITVAADGVSKQISVTANITAKGGTGGGTTTPSTPDATYGSVKFHFQGGTLVVPQDNEALWDEMGPQFDSYYPEAPGKSATYPGTKDVIEFGRANNVDKLDINIWIKDGAPWKWLGDYMLANISGFTMPTTNGWSNRAYWFFSTAGFFTATVASEAQETYGKGDWTEAGKPEKWQPAYIFAHKPTKSGDEFLGWYNNAQGSGSPLTSLAGVSDVYACWKNGSGSSTPTSAAIVANPTSLSFSGKAGSAIASKTITVTGSNLSSTPVVSCNSADFELQSNLSKTTGTITVTPKANLVSGSYSATITISGDGVSAQVTLSATILDADQIVETEADVTYGSVKFYYQGGELSVPQDNEVLWDLFMPDYNAWYASHLPSGVTSWKERATQAMKNVTTFAPAYMKDFVTNSASAWKWLGEYVASVSSAKGTDLNAIDPSEEEAFWRYAVSHFFNCSAARKDWPATVSYEAEGKPEAWKPFYIIKNKPTKANSTFIGWYDNAQGTGSAITKAPTSGDVYACWSGGTTTLIENATKEIRILPTFSGVEIFFEGTAQVVVYNVNGMQVTAGVATEHFACDLPAGMYIIRVNNEMVKFVR